MAKKRPGPSRPSEGPGRPPRKFRLADRTPAKAKSLIGGKFKQIEKTLKKEFPDKFSTEIMTFKKKDGSVTADLNIRGIDPRVKIDQILMGMHDPIDQSAINGVWLSVGFYNPPNVDIESEEGYSRVRGTLFYRTYARRWTKQNSTLIVEQGRQSQESFMDQHNRRPLSIVLRAWWNPEGRRPRRKKVKKKKGR